jgi:hypothetical protein
MNSSEIRALLQKLQRDKDVIANQVTEAKRRAAADGVYSDIDWLNSAESAMRIKGRQIGKLQIELSNALKEEKAMACAIDKSTFEREFMRKAREILPRALYEQVIAETVDATK